MYCQAAFDRYYITAFGPPGEPCVGWCRLHRQALLILGRAATKCSDPFTIYIPKPPSAEQATPWGASGQVWVDYTERLFFGLGRLRGVLYQGRLDVLYQGRLGQIRVDCVMGRLIWDYQESADNHLRVADSLRGGCMGVGREACRKLQIVHLRIGRFICR